MSLRTRACLAVTAAATLVLSLSACAAPGDTQPSAASGPVTLTFWHEMTGPAATELDALVSQFNEREAGAITVEASYQGSYADAQTKYTAAVQSGSTPDVLMMNDTSTGFLVDSKKTVPLSSFTDGDESFSADSFPPIVRSYYNDGSGGLAAMPFSVSQPVLYVDRALATQAGLNPDTPPTTLADVASWAEKIHAVTGAYGLSMNMADSWMLEEMSASGGELFCTPDNGRGSDRATGLQLTSPTQVGFMKTLQKLFLDGTALNPGTDNSAMVSAFATGKVGLMLTSSGAYTTADPQKTASKVAAFPRTSNSADAGVVIGGNALWISGDGHSTAQQEAAYTFVTFLHSAEVQAAWASATGYLASNTDAGSTSTGAQMLADPNSKAMADQLANTPATTASAGCRTGALPALRPTVIAAFTKVVEGADVADTMRDAENQAAQQIAAYNQAAG
ncbi:ABC-type sugar transport system, periplasmic component [Microbacterium testaceum StLB037]|uniref:ABC-type sugar transport system, periplasmic component n=1 Tax=Microbacterium testaceum (strain StLB037) TaxID=979556 RepID=E8NA18_MICTS|nr:ABC transporter substrate-binding protein [Microbacterium testaceum]BAJ75848.1 ABC-type sugar transport system, periplasmic component [Microbacterium testaceum StLB037]